MPDTYTQLYYHFVWSTARRQPWISPSLEAPLYRFIRYKCTELGVAVLALNGMPDHVHLAASLPARLSVSQFMHDVKGASAHFINQHPGVEGPCRWQAGYAALTFTKAHVAAIVGYIDGQKSHHAEGRLSASMEATADVDRVAGH